MLVDTPAMYYRRHLPHYQPPWATFFITFRLAGSLPREVVGRLREEQIEQEKSLMQIKDKKDRDQHIVNQRKRYFSKFDEALDRCSEGPQWLKEAAVAHIVKEAIHHRDGKVYDLLAYCIMPNHMLFVGRNDIPTYRILQSLKRHIARQANEHLGRLGAFWQDESYDHVVRGPRELKRIVAYVLNNPVKAALVKSWREWKWSYVHRDVVC
jgi:putative transposase